jgi:hypothetical protein
LIFVLTGCDLKLCQASTAKSSEAAYHQSSKAAHLNRNSPMADTDRPLNRGALLLKKKLDKARVGNADKRARKDVKPKSGTFKDRVKDAAKKTPEKRGLPAIRKETLPAVRKENLPAIRKENLPAIRRENLPAAKPNTFGVRAAGRLAGPVGALIGMTEPAGEGSDKPVQSLRKKYSSRIGPNKPANADGAMSTADVQKSYRSISRGTKTDDPVLGVRRRIATPKLRPDNLKTSVKKKVEKRKPEKKSKTRIAFEKEFAAARKKGKKSFASKLGKFGQYSTKLK